MKTGQLVKVVDEVEDDGTPFVRHHLHGQIGIVLEKTMSSFGFEPSWYEVLIGDRIYSIHFLDLIEL